MTVHTLDHSGLRGRLDDLKWRGKSQIAKTQSSMHTNPMKWAGIAAGSGFAIGLIGRLLHVRRNRLSRMPQVVVIEPVC